MANGIRIVELETAILSGSLLLSGTDKFGKNQILTTVQPINEVDLEFIEITAEQWGNRKVIIPAFSDETTAGASGPFQLPIYPELIANSTITVKARRTGAGSVSSGAILGFQIAADDGSYPAPMARHMGELHTQFIEGTAASGSFGTAGTQDVLNEEANDEWMPLMTASVGDTPGQVKWSHPNDEGFPPFGVNVADNHLGLGVFQVIPPTNVLRGADTLTLLAKDDAAAAVDGFLYTGRVTNGRVVLSNRSPFGQ